MLKLWKYEEVDVRDDVKTELPDNWELKIFKVISGEEPGKRYSGKPYYVQVLKSKDTKSVYFFCGCPEGEFRAPLEVLKAGKLCKHSDNLATFLKEKGKL